MIFISFILFLCQKLKNCKNFSIENTFLLQNNLPFRIISFEKHFKNLIIKKLIKTFSLLKWYFFIIFKMTLQTAEFYDLIIIQFLLFRLETFFLSLFNYFIIKLINCVFIYFFIFFVLFSQITFVFHLIIGKKCSQMEPFWLMHWREPRMKGDTLALRGKIKKGKVLNRVFRSKYLVSQMLNVKFKC